MPPQPFDKSTATSPVRAEHSNNEESESLENGAPDPDTLLFKHAPLSDPKSQVRLLRLPPGKDNDDIICELEVYELDEAPPYHAISYTWGTPHQPKTILIDGKRLVVYRNCHYALWQARIHRDVDALVWIDRISINQSDITEKECQVRRISEIFNKATSTLACIGPHDDSSLLIIEQLITMNETKHAVAAPTGHCAGCAHQKRDVRIRSGDPGHGLHVWREGLDADVAAQLQTALEIVDQRPYWSRVWILPEIAMSETVHILCGHDMVALHDVRHMVATFLMADSRISGVLDFYRVQFTKGVQDWAWMLARAQCSMARDRIYALLT